MNEIIETPIFFKFLIPEELLERRLKEKRYWKAVKVEHCGETYTLAMLRDEWQWADGEIRPRVYIEHSE